MNKKFIENIYDKIYMKISQMNKKFIKKMRIKSFRSSFTIEKKIPLIDIQNQIKIFKSFPNACIVYRIILIIPITISFYIQKDNFPN